MTGSWRVLVALVFVFPEWVAGQEGHEHPAPEKLGEVSFQVSCKADVQQEFDRGVALLHSFAYSSAEASFRKVADLDPECSMAYWGMAMTHFHQLWEPHLPQAGISTGRAEIVRAEAIGGRSGRERGFINALGFIFKDADSVDYATRGLKFERAMGDLAATDRTDVEAQVFYALALLSNASPADKTHSRQKQAADVLEPLYGEFPNHPGIPHYLIHAYDNAELAQRGLAAARAYSKIAPSAPHALHMPSHIFTRLGLWDDSIASNIAARDAAHRLHDTGEELHAMDYLAYAYLQSGRNEEAAMVIKQLREMPNLNIGDFKVGYAAAAMPVRYAVERRDWKGAEEIVLPPDGAPPQVAAIAVWARGLGLARDGHGVEAGKEAVKLGELNEKLRAAGNDYWAMQVSIMEREVQAWAAEAASKSEDAVTLMRSAADEEDALEKLPVTPGPIVPAREQLGELLLEQGHSREAAKEFKTALVNAPGRRGAMLGAALAAKASAAR